MLQGGYMEAKKQKLQAQFVADKPHQEGGQQSNIFQGISIFVNGYTSEMIFCAHIVLLDLIYYHRALRGVTGSLCGVYH